MTRVYSSPLRAEQAEQTRQRLLVKLAEMMADDSVTDISVAEVARHAGVSVRTAYRYFPTKEDLLDAFNQDGALPFEGRTPERPTDPAELARFGEQLMDWYAKNETILRAYRWSKTAGEARKRRKVAQIRHIAELLRPITSHLPEGDARAVIALLHTMQSSNVFIDARDAWKVEPDELARGMSWVTRVVLAQLAKDQKKK